MNRVIRHSEYLLQSNDCIIMPGLGAVLAHDESARIDEATGMLVPPTRRFSFNSMLTQNDGLLATSVARCEGIGYDAALRIVTDEIESMRHQLVADGELSLGHIGLLKLDGDKMLFEPYDASSLTPGLLWLPTVRITPLSERVKADDAAVAAASRRRISPLVRFARTAAAVAVAIGLGFVMSTPITTDNAQLASFAPEAVKAPSRPAESLFERPGTSTAPLVLVLRHHTDAATAVDTTAKLPAPKQVVQKVAVVEAAEIAEVAEVAEVAKTSQSTLRFDESDSYCLVVASLATQEEADRFIARNSKQQLGVLPKDGRYRVYAATGTTAAGAQSAAAELADRYPNAWVCRR